MALQGELNTLQEELLEKQNELIEKQDELDDTKVQLLFHLRRQPGCEAFCCFMPNMFECNLQCQHSMQAIAAPGHKLRTITQLSVWGNAAQGVLCSGGETKQNYIPILGCFLVRTYWF